jgi:hypothetical protein
VAVQAALPTGVISAALQLGRAGALAVAFSLLLLPRIKV